MGSGGALKRSVRHPHMRRIGKLMKKMFVNDKKDNLEKYSFLFCCRSHTEESIVVSSLQSTTHQRSGISIDVWQGLDDLHSMNSWMGSIWCRRPWLERTALSMPVDRREFRSELQEDRGWTRHSTYRSRSGRAEPKSPAENSVQ